MPQIHEVMTYREALSYAKTMQHQLVPYEMEESLEGASGMAGTRAAIEAVQPGDMVAVFIGPEGGFAEDEIDAAIGQGMKPITLGRRILRTETAGLTVMAWIMYHAEN